jgi:hypothetical protein
VRAAGRRVVGVGVEVEVGAEAESACAARGVLDGRGGVSSGTSNVIGARGGSDVASGGGGAAAPAASSLARASR